MSFQLFTKRNNFCDFLFATRPNLTLPTRDLLLKDRICYSRANSVFEELTQIEKGGKHDSDEVASPDKIFSEVNVKWKPLPTELPIEVCYDTVNS